MARKPVQMLAVAAVLALCFVWATRQLPHSFLSYATRPIWDTTEDPRTRITHYYAEGVNATSLCALHGWKTRDSQRQVWDAVLMSTEVDMLLIRLHELSPVVDKFFILESRRTFTGIEKPILLESALKSSDFDPFRSRITYQIHDGRKPKLGESPFAVEGETRGAMTHLLRSALQRQPDSEPPIMLFSDVDELPSRHTISLLQQCKFPSPLHLGLRDYSYSFEFPSGDEAASWRARAVIWRQRGQGSEEYYRHGKVTENVLVDSGWHCSWCFPKINDFVTKAQGYSHFDRLGTRGAALLTPTRIQQVICSGHDFFNMLPEAYSYLELAHKMSPRKSKSAVNLPKYVIEQASRFKYLLPGGCQREG